MAKLLTDIFFKANIEGLLYYRYRDMMIVRTISGFTSEAVRTSTQYVLTRNNASEFGRVSALCKQVRMALVGILPKQNNLAVVNSFTKKMREVLEYDTTNKRGERQLANALATENGRQLLKCYEFNPDTTIVLDYVLTEDSLTITTNTIKFPKGVHHLGFRVHQLAFDFTTGENELVSGEWVMENKVVTLDSPSLPDTSGIVFTLLEAQFYDDVNGVYVAMVEDRGKSVLMVEIK